MRVSFGSAAGTFHWLRLRLSSSARDSGVQSYVVFGIFEMRGKRHQFINDPFLLMFSGCPGRKGKIQQQAIQVRLHLFRYYDLLT